MTCLQQPNGARIVFLLLFAALLLPLSAQTPATNTSGFQFIDTSFENASPVWYEIATNGTIQVHLLYDHERSSPNRAAGHFHFQVHATTGSKLTIELRNLDNVWNGQHGSISRELKAAVVSENGRDWTSVPLETFETNRTRLNLTMTAPTVYVARVEPYRISDLQRLLDSIRNNPRVEITTIGKTVANRDLEIIRIGNIQAPHRVFLRARAHPWEAGGNWIVEGLVRRLLRDDAEAAEFLKRYTVWIMPMANKDGVALGRTRFNLRGKDLNRNWDKPADPQLSPENHALEKWLESMIAAGRKPDLALELHNDGNGKFHISRPPVPGLDLHVKRMQRFEQLLRKYTWFTEGATNPEYRNSGTLGEGWLQRYGIDAAVHEFNCNWIAGLKQPPNAKHWQDYGAGLAKVFYEYFAEPNR